MKRVLLILAAMIGLTLGGLLPMSTADARPWAYRGYAYGPGVTYYAGPGYAYRGYYAPYYSQPYYRSYYRPYATYYYGYPGYSYGYPAYYYGYPQYSYYGSGVGVYVR
jgi:hypothetical protein